MADLLATSARYIDNDIYEGAGLVNRPTTELSEIAPGIALIEAFSHVVAFKSGDGLVLFDTSLEAFGQGVLKSLRGWTRSPSPISATPTAMPIMSAAPAPFSARPATGAPAARRSSRMKMSARASAATS